MAYSPAIPVGADGLGTQIPWKIACYERLTRAAIGARQVYAGLENIQGAILQFICKMNPTE